MWCPAVKLLFQRPIWPQLLPQMRPDVWRVRFGGSLSFPARVAGPRCGSGGTNGASAPERRRRCLVLIYKALGGHAAQPRRVCPRPRAMRPPTRKSFVHRNWQQGWPQARRVPIPEGVSSQHGDQMLPGNSTRSSTRHCGRKPDSQRRPQGQAAPFVSEI
jgi:hypothetical protein